MDDVAASRRGAFFEVVDAPAPSEFAVVKSDPRVDVVELDLGSSGANCFANGRPGAVTLTITPVQRLDVAFVKDPEPGPGAVWDYANTVQTLIPSIRLRRLKRWTSTAVPVTSPSDGRPPDSSSTPAGLTVATAF